MNTATNYAALYLADISKNQQEMEKVAREYPVSAAARFLWLYELKKNNDSRFNEVAKQTGIFLHNPSWMEFQLSDISITNGNNNLAEAISLETNSISETYEMDQNFVEEDLLPVKNDEELNQPVNEEIIENPVSENENIIDQNIEKDIQNQQSISEENEATEIAEKQNNEESIQPVNEEIIENPVLENENIIDQNIEENTKEQQSIAEENEAVEIAEKRNDQESIQPVNEQIIENPVLENENIIDQNIEEDTKEQQSITEENEVVEIAEKQNDEESIQPVNEEIIENPVLENNEDQNIEEAKKEELIISNENEENDNEDAIPFEPLHTVDYFASQGIKLSEDALNNDQLGKQVKSFTAWIKSMKKLHPGQLPEQNEVIERLIQTSSEASNKSADVLTEAMAEVLIKQNKREKAIEMYQKLSLINPSKSAYFAAKIESLKIV